MVVNYPGEVARAEAEQTAARIEAAGGTALALCADVGSEAEVLAMVSRASATLGPPDILINNAAISVAARTRWATLAAEDWDRVLRVNVTAAFLCARAVYPAMRSTGRGDVINVSSITALLGRAGNLHYVTSKAALIGFTRALAREVGAEGIRVNALLVGAIQTPDEAAYGTPDEVDTLVLAEQSLKRRGLPSDVAGTVAYLVSPDAAFITGQCLTVDGGWVMY